VALLAPSARGRDNPTCVKAVVYDRIRRLFGFVELARVAG